MSSLVRRLSVGRALAAIVFLACGADQTKPGGGPDPSIPVVTAVQPGTILATNLPQPVTILGSGFDAPTVVLVSPAGDTTQVAGSQLSASATRISAQATVATAGAWKVLVKNGTGKSSGPFSFTVGPSAPPVVQSVSPGTLVVASFFTSSPQRVTITGTGFQKGSIILFTDGEITQAAGVPSSLDSLSSTLISFTMSVTGRFDFDLFVLNPDGQISASSVHLAGRLNIPDPTVTSIAPATIGMSAVKQIIAFTGAGFESGIDMLLTAPSGSLSSFSGTAVQTPTPGTIRVFALLNAAGTWKYSLTNPDLTQVNGTFTVGPPLPNQTLPPVITGIVPSNPVVAGNAQVITLQGTSFQSGLIATFSSQSAGFSDSGQVVTVAPNAVQMNVLLGQPGTWFVGVQNPDGAPSSTFTFTVAAGPPSAPAPINIAAVQPSAVLTSLASQFVLLNGRFPPFGFVKVTPPAADLNVTFGSFFSDFLARSEIRLNGVFDRAGTWHVEVDSVSTQSNVFDIVVSTPNSPAPVVTALDPPPFVSGQAQLLHVRGSNFQPGLRILVVGDDSSRTYSPPYFSVDSVTSTSARFNGGWPVSGRLQIQNPDGQVSNTLRFAANPLPFSCMSPGVFYRSDSTARVSMSCQSAKAGLAVALTDPAGTSRPTSSVTLGNVFGSSAFASFTTVLDMGGTWNVALTNPDGQRFSVPFFVYTFPAPTTTGRPPSVVASHTPQPIAIQGTGFQSGATVSVGLSSAFGLPSTVFSDAQIVNFTPTSAQVSPRLWFAGQWAVVVNNPDGQSAGTTVTVTGQASPPSVSGVSPSTLAASTPRLITVTGQDFEKPLSVTVTPPIGAAITLSPGSLINLSSSQFQFFMGFDQPGTWRLVVRNFDNQLSNAVAFTVQ